MKTTNKIMGAGIGIAVAAAGAYFINVRRGAKNRAAIEGWALKLRGKVLEKMKNMKEIDQQAFETLVERTVARYGKGKRVGAAELKKEADDIKSAWSYMGKQLVIRP